MPMGPVDRSTMRAVPRGKNDPGWSDRVGEWKAVQAALRERLIVAPLRPPPRFVAGADMAFSSDKKTAYAAARGLRSRGATGDRSRPRHPAGGRPVYPRVPQLPRRAGIGRSHRPARTPVRRRLLRRTGYAHPRRCGLACHVAITLDVPAVGVAKSRLIGTFDEPAVQAGSSSPLTDRGEQIGVVLRTRDDTRPLFISVGHRADLPSAVEMVLACCTRYRVPEPTRQADIEVARLKRQIAGR